MNSPAVASNAESSLLCLGVAVRLWQQRAQTPSRSSALKNYLIAIAAAIAVTGCAQQPTLVTAAAEEQNEGIAKTCTPSPVDFGAGSTATANIVMTNDGWCALRTKDKNGQPFKFGLVKMKPQHGYILIQKVGNETRIEYTVENRYVGSDKFSVALASNQPNTPDSSMGVTVSVARGEGVAPPAAEAAPTPTTTPARRSTRH